MLDLAYNTPTVTFGGTSFGGATDDNPKWYFKLNGTSAQSYTLPTASKTLAASDGSNASGTWGISISGNAANVTGTVGIAQGGTGQTTAPNAINYLLNNGCTEGTSPAQLNDYLIAQYAGGGTTTTTYHRRKISNVMKAFMPGVITVGTAAPSGGSNGDIYIQYS